MGQVPNFLRKKGAIHFQVSECSHPRQIVNLRGRELFGDYQESRHVLRFPVLWVKNGTIIFHQYHLNHRYGFSKEIECFIWFILKQKRHRIE